MENKKMANISIYREANKGQISSYHHLVNMQDFSNQDPNNNPNKDNSNLFIYVDDNGKYQHNIFYRDGSNQKLMDNLKQSEMELDNLAREDYKNHKLLERAANPNKKIRTVLQSKDLKKEFIIALGGDKNITPSDFANKAKKAVDEIMKAKGLTRKNIIGIFIHNEEKVIHLHCIHSSYSFDKKTTATQLAKPKITKGMSKEEKSQLVKLQRQEFGKFQDIVADAMGMQRGKVNSRAKHTTKAQHFEAKAKEVEKLDIALFSKTKELELIKKEVEEIKKLTSAEINALANSKKQLQTEYNTFEDNLKQKLQHLIEIKNQLRINSNMPFLPAPEVNLDILIAGLNTELGLNWKLKDLEKTYIAGQYCLQKLSYPDLPKLIKNAEELSKKINARLERENVLALNQRTR